MNSSTNIPLNKINDEEDKKPVLVEIKSNSVDIKDVHSNKSIIVESQPIAEANKEVIPSTGIEENGNIIIDHDRKLIIDKEKYTETMNKNMENASESKTPKPKKPLKKITIKEIPNKTCVPVTKTPMDSDNQSKSESSKSGKENKGEENKSDDNSNSVDSTSEAKRHSGELYKLY